MERIRGIIFDLDGTLNRSKLYYEAFEDTYPKVISSLLGIDREIAAERLNQGKNEIKMGFTKLIRHIGIDSSVFFTRMAIELPVDDLIEMDQRLGQMLIEIKKMGVSLALLSNTGRALVTRTMGALGILNGIFDVIVTSDETELKPDPEPYRYTASMLGIQITECMYVGDRVEMEIRTARRLGMVTTLLGSEDMRNESDYLIENLFQLPPIIMERV